MGFSKYEINKKQISLDRGVTWVDVEPSETERGKYIGTYRTLLQCQNGGCDLEKYEYSIVDGDFPTEFCGDVISTLPSGIAKTIQWTAGAVCCTEWQTATPYFITAYGLRRDVTIGHPLCNNDRVCPSYEYYKMGTLNGSEIHNDCFTPYPNCAGETCSCFQVTEFMPWAESKQSWKLIVKQHYIREYCSSEWELDGETEVVGIAERWILFNEDFYNEKWVHQVAKTLDDNGNVSEWESQGNLITRTMTEAMLDDDIEILEYVVNDGVLSYGSKYSSINEDNVDGTVIMNLSLDSGSSEFGGTVYHLYNYDGSRYTWYLASEKDWDLYDIEKTVLWSDYWQTGVIRGTIGKMSNSFTPYFFLGTSRRSVQLPSWKSYFCDIQITRPTSATYAIGSVNNILDGTFSGKLIGSDGVTAAFPCRIHENLGQNDDYWNSSQIGYVFRNGDGKITTMEYIVGKYVDNNGNTELKKVSQFSFDNNDWVVPDEAVSFTFLDVIYKIPSSVSSNKANLVNVTFGFIQEIGFEAFQGCTSLTNVIFPYTLSKIDSGAFKGCTRLTSVNIPSSMTVIGAQAFSGCTSLTSITFNSETPPTFEPYTFDDTNDCPIYVPSQSVEAYKTAYNFTPYAERIQPMT